MLGGKSLFSEGKRGEPQGIPLLHALILAELRCIKMIEQERKRVWEIGVHTQIPQNYMYLYKGKGENSRDFFQSVQETQMNKQHKFQYFAKNIFAAWKHGQMPMLFRSCFFLGGHAIDFGWFLAAHFQCLIHPYRSGRPIGQTDRIRARWNPGVWGLSWTSGSGGFQPDLRKTCNMKPMKSKCPRYQVLLLAFCLGIFSSLGLCLGFYVFVFLILDDALLGFDFLVFHVFWAWWPCNHKFSDLMVFDKSSYTQGVGITGFIFFDFVGYQVFISFRNGLEHRFSIRILAESLVMRLKPHQSGIYNIGMLYQAKIPVWLSLTWSSTRPSHWTSLKQSEKQGFFHVALRASNFWRLWALRSTAPTSPSTTVY